MRPREIIGVDFSGAAEAGRNIWIARCAIAKGRRLRLTSLDRLENLAGSAKRDVALPWLLNDIQTSDRALWGIDCPFGLPVELGWKNWPALLRAMTKWTTGASEFGRHCCERSMSAVGTMHVRRMTDRETRTPFDCHHYRIIHQTFHGIRELMVPLRRDPTTCVLPFDVDTLATADRVVAEACPGSTLKRLALPHSRYKQAKPGRVAARFIKTRKTILAGIEPFVEIDETSRRTMLNNPGGDALDAVLAAVGVWSAWKSLDVAAIAAHARYRHEGLVFC